MTFDKNQMASLGMSQGSDGVILGPGLREVPQVRRAWLPAAYMSQKPKIQYEYTPPAAPARGGGPQTPMQQAHTKGGQW